MKCGSGRSAAPVTAEAQRRTWGRLNFAARGAEGGENSDGIRLRRDARDASFPMSMKWDRQENGDGSVTAQAIDKPIRKAAQRLKLHPARRPRCLVPPGRFRARPGSYGARRRQRHCAVRRVILTVQSKVIVESYFLGGSNNSTGFPAGSSTRTCLPPIPDTISLRNLAPDVRRRSTSSSMFSTSIWMRFQPPGSGLRPSGMG